MHYLIGNVISDFSSNECPSIKNVLKLFLYYHIDLKQSIRKSANLVVDKVRNIWDQHHLTVLDKNFCVYKLEALHAEWINYKKSSTIKIKSKNGKINANKRINNYIIKLNGLWNIKGKYNVTSKL